MCGTLIGMTEKAAFNAEEWSKLVEAPALAALRVVAADRGGTIRESLSLGRAYAEVREEGGGLLGEIAATCLLYTSPSPRDGLLSRMPSSA